MFRPHASTSSGYRRDRRSMQQESGRNDSYGRDSQMAFEARNLPEAHHSRESFKKVNHWLKSQVPPHPTGSLFSRPYGNQSKQKSESEAEEKEEWFVKLDKMYPLEKDVYQDSSKKK